MPLGTSLGLRSKRVDTASEASGDLYNRHVTDSWKAGPVDTMLPSRVTTTENGPSDITKPVRQPLPLLGPFTEPAKQVREIKVQEWEGRVLEIAEDTFDAALLDMTGSEPMETEQVTLLKSDLTEEDRKLLAPGAIFRWVIGYHFGGGLKDRFARLVFRRLPVWTPDEIRAADEKARHLAQSIRWDEGAAIAKSD